MDKNIDISDAIGQGTFNMLVFCYNGNASSDDPTSKLFILKDTNSITCVAQMSDMEEAGFQINGAIQLSFDQMAFMDNNIVGASKFLVTDDGGNWGWLHEVEIWAPSKYLERTESSD